MCSSGFFWRNQVESLKSRAAQIASLHKAVASTCPTRRFGLEFRTSGSNRVSDLEGDTLIFDRVAASHVCFGTLSRVLAFTRFSWLGSETVLDD